MLGEYQRGYRILAAFSATGRPEDLGTTMAPRWRSLLAASLALFALQLGRLAEAWAIQQVDDGWSKSLGERKETSIRLLNSSDVAFARGRLADSRALAEASLIEAEAAKDPDLMEPWRLGEAHAVRAIAAHGLGDILSARADFASATELV